jgi:tetratricopeptide (TPR) repeat protein/TolB-like protein
VLARKAAEPLPYLRAVRETVPEEVEQAISKALARVPADRHSTAQQFQQALASGMRRSAQYRAVRQRRRLYVLTSLAVIVALAVTVQLIRGPSVRLQPNRVVVGTFEDQTSVPELATFGAIVADRITQGLMGGESIEAVPSPQARDASQFALQELDEGRARDFVRAIAEETGAAIVVTGFYYFVSDSVLIQGQVTDAEHRRSLGSVQSVKAPVEDPIGAIDAVMDQIAGLLAVTFDPRLAPSVGAATRPPSFEAYRAFNDGMEQYVRATTPDEWREAAPYFARGYALDSTFVRSLLYEALSYNNSRARREADSVLQIAAPMRDQLSAYERNFLDYRIAFYAADREATLRAIRRVAEIAPGSKAVYNLGLTLFEANRLREAREVLESLDPTRGPMRGWLPYWRILSGSFHLEKDHRRELRVARRARRVFPDQPRALGLEVRAVAARGQAEAVAALLAEAQRTVIDGSDDLVGELTAMAATELRAHGHTEKAAQMFGRAMDWYEGMPVDSLSPGARATYARVLYALEQWDEASALYAALAAERPERIAFRAQLGRISARRGDRAAALDVAAWLANLDHRFRFGMHTYQRAAIAAVLGESDEAVRLLREAFGQGYPAGDMTMHRDFDLEGLYDYEPYIDLMQPQP